MTLKDQKNTTLIKNKTQQLYFVEYFRPQNICINDVLVKTTSNLDFGFW